jgi:hypothetical protein
MVRYGRVKVVIPPCAYKTKEDKQLVRIERKKFGRILALLGFGCLIISVVSLLHLEPAGADVAGPLATGTYCQGPQTYQPQQGPQKVMMIVLENESSVSVDNSPDATFQSATLQKQCGNFLSSQMHSTTHGSESNYFAMTSGLNASLTTGNDALARFGLSDCPPDSTSSSCSYGGGHFASGMPSIFSQIESQYGSGGWKTYADDMPANCSASDGNYYATDATGTRYSKYAVRHNPAVYFNGTACAAQDVPSGNWQGGQGALYSDLMNGTLPQFSFIEPNQIENGHDPVSVNGVTIAGGTSPIGNIDTYLSNFLGVIHNSPDYQNGNLTVMVTYDEGYACGSGVSGECSVGENCADPTITPLATSCQVKTWIVGRYVPSTTYGGYMNQFGLLAATQKILHLSPLLAHAGDGSTPDIVNGTYSNPDPFNLAPPSTYVPPAPTVSSAPIAVTAAAGNTSASVSFTAPSSSGGANITGYTVTSNPGGITASGVASPISVTGLTNGASYTFTVTATNVAGNSPASDPSNAVTPTAFINLLTDGGFETGVTKVNPYGANNKVVSVTSPVHSGSLAAQVNNTNSGTTGLNLPNIPGTNIKAGQSLTGSCWVYLPPGSGSNYKPVIAFYEGTSYAMLSDTVSATLVPGVWTQVSGTATVKNTGDQITMSAYTNNQVGGAPGLVWDDCSVRIN